MPKPEQFSSFAQFGEQVKKERSDEIRERFEELLKDRLADIPAGSYATELPGVLSMVISHYTDKDVNAALNLTCFFERNGKRRNVTFRLYNSGDIGGDRIPSELGHLTHDTIKEEVFRIVRNINPKRWYPVGLDIIPLADEGVVRTNAVEPAESHAEKAIDSRRIKFLEGQSDYLFGFYEKDLGFNGYRGAVFPNFIILEHEVKGNAAFIIDLARRIELDQEMRKRIERGMLPREEGSRIAEGIWRPIGSVAKTRTQLVERFGAERVPHQGREETWKQKIQNAIDRRRARA